MKTYSVRVTKQCPAWDERGGFDLEITADTKAQAIRYARRQMNDDGHTGPGCGRSYFKATEIVNDDQPASPVAAE